MSINRLVHSSYVSQGPYGHRTSSLAQLGYDGRPFEAKEVVFSSAWLWNQRALEHPRFSVSFPDEWQSLVSISNQFPNWSYYLFDFWIFKNLSLTEIDELKTLMSQHPQFRIVIAINHLMDWVRIVSEIPVDHWKSQNQIFFSFLPSQNPLDPFLKPQEVLEFLKQDSTAIPILIHDFPEKKRTFEQDFDPAAFALELKKSRFIALKSLMTLDRLGFERSVLALEAFFGFMVQGRFQRLLDLINHLRHEILIQVKRLSYPFRKIYWFLSYQYQTRIRRQK